jgi:O-antigen/teichoic acid export membrane protein
MKDLKQRTIRGGLARMGAQVSNIAIRAGSLMILARLLTPRDFGLVGMVTAFTGVLNLLRDFGLSSAAVQRATVTDEQISTLFWINILVGTILGVLTAASAPLLASFYREPRLVPVTIALGAAFVFNAVGVQHSALLQRQMRFTAMAVIQVVSLTVGTVLAIVGAKAGYGYWALVGMSLCVPLVGSLGAWLAAGWVPGMPRKGTGIGSMMRFGGTVSLNGIVAYLAYNADKVLIGRFWGTDVLGIYGRSYQLVNIPTDNLNSAVGEVAFSALSRVQDDPIRFRSYFLKGYSLVLAMTLPLTIACVVFAHDVVLVLLGPKWLDGVAIFRFLAPTILIFAVINPLGWLLLALGLVKRSLNIALVFAPTLIIGYFIGLPYGPRGVAFAYSTVMALWVVPFIFWCVRGTPLSFRDVAGALVRPLAFGIAAGVAAFAASSAFMAALAPFLRLVLETGVLLTTFATLLLLVGGQRSFYLDLIRGMRKSPESDGAKLNLDLSET